MKKKYLVLVPETEDKYIKSLNYSFGKENVKVVSEYMTKKESVELVDYINNSFEKVIFFELGKRFNDMLPIISTDIKKDWIFKYPIAYFSKNYVYNYFLQTLENKKRGLIDEIYALDYDLYYVFKGKIKYLKLDIDEKNKKCEIKNEIGIIGYDYEDFSNFHNMLSTFTFFENYVAKVENIMVSTKKFAKDFNIKIRKCNSYDEVLSNSLVNLHVALAGVDIPVVLESLDQGIPCIVGNTSMFDSNKYLKEQLVLKSDDSINEIAEKIKSAIKNKKEILKEYKKFRENYKKEVKKIMGKFDN